MDSYHGHDMDAVLVEKIGKRGNKRRLIDKKKKRPAKMPGGIRQRRNKHLLW